jgi:tight adherence protein B
VTGLAALVVVVTCLASGHALVTATRAVVRTRRRLPRPLPVSSLSRRAGGRLASALRRADIAMAADEAVRVGIGGVLVAGLFGLVVGGPAVAATVVVAVAVAASLALLALQGRRERRADAGLPAVLDDVARALRGGAAPGVALAEATSGAGATAARDEVQSVVDDLRSGLGSVDALERWARRRPTGPVRLTVGALAIGSSAGGPRSRAVDAVAATLRERQALEREATALATQARSSALVIALAPLAFAALATLGDPRTGAFLVGTRTGVLCLTLGLLLDGLGGWWMHRIVRLS